METFIIMASTVLATLAIRRFGIWIMLVILRGEAHYHWKLIRKIQAKADEEVAEYELEHKLRYDPMDQPPKGNGSKLDAYRSRQKRAAQDEWPRV